MNTLWWVFTVEQVSAEAVKIFQLASYSLVEKMNKLNGLFPTLKHGLCLFSLNVGRIDF